jgi:hypothetical protein
MTRREAKFVHASPRLAPEQIKAAAHMRETRARQPARIGPPRPPIAAPESGRRGKSPVKWS